MSERNPDSGQRTCACGCGENANPGYRFIQYHQNRTRRLGPLTPEHKRKLALARAKGPLERICQQCGKAFTRSRRLRGDKFCGNACHLEHLNATQTRATGASAVNWKGDEAGYKSIHTWVNRHYSKRGQCETCGAQRKTDWANVDHRYRRVRADWVELCRPCHRRRDIEAGITPPMGSRGRPVTA